MTFWRQPSLFETPKPGDTVKDGVGRYTRADGKTVTRRGHTFTWLACDRCGEGTWVAGLAPDQGRLENEEYRKEHGRPCRMTPRCDGRHVRTEVPFRVE